MDEKRKISIERASMLHDSIAEYTAFKKSYQGAGSSLVIERTEKQKQKIMDYFHVSEQEWNDWSWQLRNRISDVDILAEFLQIDADEKRIIRNISKQYRWAVTPYFLSLMDTVNKDNPINQLAIPSVLEYDGEGDLDPMGEEYTNPAACITRRYPNRLIINVTSACSAFCRHCQRRRRIGEVDKIESSDDIRDAIAYIRDNEEIRDVLITGGDPLILTDTALEDILIALREIPHVEIIRIGTRTPATLPQRITDDLVNMLKKYHPIYVNIQFDHPLELTNEAAKACKKLADAGIPLGNQMVFLNGINNDKFVVQMLNEELLKLRVRPYYIFHPKQVKGTKHFQIKIEEGLEIMKYLRGRSSGLSVPQYIMNAPNGLGKIPLMHNYIIETDSEHTKLLTWENREIEISY